MKYLISQFLNEKLTGAQLMDLSETLNVSQTKCARLISGTDAWEATQLLKLAKIINISPESILEQVDLKNTITLSEFQEIKSEFQAPKKVHVS